mgnify:CR=1 FL=1
MQNPKDIRYQYESNNANKTRENKVWKHKTFITPLSQTINIVVSTTQTKKTHMLV